MQAQELIKKVCENNAIAIETFKQYRLSSSVVCKKCGHTSHYWMASKNQFQCKKCRFRTTIRSGSVMENSKLPLAYFFISMVLLAKTSGNLTVDELHKFTGHKYYEPIWGYLHKMKLYYKEKGVKEHFATFIANL
ncbi:MAG: transposase [Bacteroidota bacterium]